MLCRGNYSIRSNGQLGLGTWKVVLPRGCSVRSWALAKFIFLEEFWREICWLVDFQSWGMKFVGPLKKFDHWVRPLLFPPILSSIWNNSGYVTHGTDRFLWALRKPDLNPKQWEVANQWVDVVQQELNKVLEAGNSHTFNQVLTLREDQTISWTIDRLWGELMDLVSILPGERKVMSSL